MRKLLFTICLLASSFSINAFARTELSGEIQIVNDGPVECVVFSGSLGRGSTMQCKMRPGVKFKSEALTDKVLVDFGSGFGCPGKQVDRYVKNGRVCYVLTGGGCNTDPGTTVMTCVQ